MSRVLIVLVVVAAAMVCGCEKKQEAPPQPAGPVAKAPAPTTPPTQPETAPAGGHHGPTVDLGTSTIGAFTVRASRDQSEIKAGGDSPIDVWLTGSDAKVVAVRFWIGTQDASGSVKAKAEIEDPKEPNRWHTHAEVPDPLPADSRIWVEIEFEEGRKISGSFDLKS